MDGGANGWGLWEQGAGSLAGRFTILDFYPTALGREVGHTSELLADHGTLLIGPFSSTENAPAVPQMHYLLKVRLSALSTSSLSLRVALETWQDVKQRTKQSSLSHLPRLGTICYGSIELCRDERTRNWYCSSVEIELLGFVSKNGDLDLSKWNNLPKLFATPPNY